MLPDTDESYSEAEYNKPVTNRPRSEAMDHLQYIVSTSGLRRDIKRVRKAESYNGAKEWARKHSNRKRKYEAKEEDIDGDGIKDVLVKAADGSLVIVNGYTVRKSDYPYRQRFANLPEATRKQHGNYKNYLKSIYGPTYDDRTGKITGWKQDPEQDEQYKRLTTLGFKTYIPKDQSPYQLFTNQVVKSTIDGIYEVESDTYAYQVYNADGEAVTKYPPVLITVAADAWNYGVVKPLIEQKTGEQIPDNITPDELKALLNSKDIMKYKKSKEFRNRSKALVEKYVSDDDAIRELIEALKERIADTTYSSVHRWLNEHHKGV